MYYTEYPAGRLDDLADGQLKKVKAGETDVLLARRDDEVFALGATCTHYGAPLEKGLLHGSRITCPWHHACFDLRTGKRLEAPALDGLPRYEVRLDDGQIYVSIPDETTDRVPNPYASAQSEPRETYLIVGGGAAAAFAIEALREEGYEGRILLVSADDRGPYDRTNCSKEYLQGEAPDEWMPLRDEAFYHRLGVEIKLNRRVRTFNAAEKFAELEDGTRLDFDKALLCTGGTPRRLEVPGADLAGVYYLRSQTDAERLRDVVQEGTRVVVIGSSFIGLEGAMSLQKRGATVAVVGRDSIPFAKKWGEPVGKAVQRWHEAAGVTFHLGTDVAELKGTDRVTAVVLESGEEVPADVVLVGTGVKPVTDYVTDLPKESDEGLRTDEYLCVTADVYAAGDMAHAPYHDGQLLRIEHWRVAQEQGRAAGLNMAGAALPYHGVPFFWTNQQGTSIRYLGNVKKFDDLILEGDPASDDGFLACYAKDGEIRAALGVKRDDALLAIHELMRRHRLPTAAEVRAGVDWKELVVNS
jgi:NADPH-dependent 2,4-dienoyl-CoA reductase/sulfur reductase-like enzyme/nitrite reductase/ring-hydroxylating ferredoxin subunit